MAADKNLKIQVLLNTIDKYTRPMKNAMKGTKGLTKAMKENREALRALEKQKGAIETYQKLRAQVRSANSTFAEASRKLEEVKRTGNASEKQLASYRAHLQRLGVARLNATQKALQARGVLRELSIGTANLGNHEKQLATRIGETTRAIERQQAELKRLSAARSTYQKTMSVRSSMIGSGAGAMAKGAAGGYAGARFLSPAVEFDRIMAKVEALTGAERGSDLYNAMRTQDRELGASTMFTAGESAGARAFLAQASFSPEDTLKAMPDILHLAIGTNTGLERTADIISNIMAGFDLGADETQRAADVLAMTTRRTNVNLEMHGQTMKYVGPVASSLGTDLETAAAMAGVLGNAGLQDGVSGTAMRAVFIRLAAPPKKAQAAFEKLGESIPLEELEAGFDAMEKTLGFSVADEAGNMRPMNEILKEIAIRTQHMGTVERNQIFAAIAGQEAISAMTVLCKQALDGNLDEVLSEVNAATGETMRLFGIMADTLAGDMNALKSAWQDLAIEVFEKVGANLRSFTKGLTEVVRKVSAWAKENPVLVKYLTLTAMAISGLLVVGGSLTMMLATMLGPFALLRLFCNLLGIKAVPTLARGLGALTRGALAALAKGLIIAAGAMKTFTLSLLANPIVLLIAAIVAVVVGLGYLIYKHWDKIKIFLIATWLAVKASAIAIWDRIKEGFEGGLFGILALIIDFSPIGLFHKAFAAVLDYFGIELPGRFSEFAGNMITGLIDGLFGEGATARLKETIDNICSSICNWIKDILGINSPSTVFAGFGGFLIDGLIQGITGKLSAARDTIVSAGKSIKDWFCDTLGIKSPSRVFAQLGVHTMEGLQVGLDKSAGLPLSAINDLSDKMRASGKLFELTSAFAVDGQAPFALPPMDTRPPLTARPSGGGGSVGPITIHIHATPGMDEKALADLVARKFDEFRRREDMRSRSSFHDFD